MVKLSTLLQYKKPGDTWQSILAPEEFKWWTMENKWKTDCFKKFNVSIAGVHISAFEPGKSNTVSFKQKEPLFLKCGIDIRKGRVTTTNRKAATFRFRVDSIIELNSALTELSQMYEFDSWEMKQIELYNPQESCYIFFTIHNPDGNGPNLSLWSVKSGRSETLYPDISYIEQKRVCGGFEYNFAHCIASKEEVLVHGCAIEKKQKASNIITRKKA